jgi:hypothetical protein
MIGVQEVIMFVLAAWCVARWRRLAEIFSNFRGPRPPMHPLASDDSVILNRRRKREVERPAR